MNTLDFNKIPVYKIHVYDLNKSCIYEGLVNIKAWNKILENNEVWEYIPENGRVINKDFSPLTLNLSTTSHTDDIISLYLEDKKESQDASGINDNTRDILTKLEEIIQSRKNDSSGKSYTAHLFEKGEEKILKKFGEESIELILARDDRDETIYEAADIIYHLLVYFVHKEIPFQTVLDELKRRMDA